MVSGSRHRRSTVQTSLRRSEGAEEILKPLPKKSQAPPVASPRRRAFLIKLVKPLKRCDEDLCQHGCLKAQVVSCAETHMGARAERLCFNPCAASTVAVTLRPHREALGPEAYLGLSFEKPSGRTGHAVPDCRRNGLAGAGAFGHSKFHIKRERLRNRRMPVQTPLLSCGRCIAAPRIDNGGHGLSRPSRLDIVKSHEMLSKALSLCKVKCGLYEP